MVPIDDVKPGMIIGEDVFSDVGQMLISANTELDEKNLGKLRLYGIYILPIKGTIDYGNIEVEQNIPAKKLTRDTQEFKNFESCYTNHSLSLQDQMLNIGEGKNINISELFLISEDLLQTVKHKRDLFNFLGNIKNFDDYTYSHSLNVSLISYTIGQWLSFRQKKLMRLAIAGLLHDIGKIKINRDILNKPGKLTDDEYKEIKKHTIYGFQLLKNQDISHDIKMAVLMHHERYDGSGYPLGVKNNQINNFAKIVAVADIYDALTSDRPYRNKFSPFHVIRQFEQDYFGHLDTRILMTFLQNIAYCYLDSYCVLSTGKKGKIIFINKQFPSRPIVQVDNVIIDLSQEQKIYIDKII